MYKPIYVFVTLPYFRGEIKVVKSYSTHLK